MTAQTPDRCRIVLITPPGATAAKLRPQLAAALAAGDVASLIVPRYELGDADFQALCAQLVPLAQAHGVAAVVAGDTRVAGRVGADGIHVEEGKAGLAEAVDRYGARMMVGTGGVKTRDDALELGEAQPDYMFFGRFGYDTKPEPHARNLSLARWWAEMIEIPCIVLAGATAASVPAAAATGAEFVALSAAVFGGDADPAAAIAEANALLDAHAPRLAEAR